jgi:hypothetical protein
LLILRLALNKNASCWSHYTDYNGRLRSFPLIGYWNLLKEEQLGSEDDHTPPFTVEIKDDWNYSSRPPYDLRAC